MKITRFLSISILLSVFFSCSHGFLKDPRLYNPKRSSAQTVAPDVELELTGGIDPFDKVEEWFNHPDSNGDGSTEESKQKRDFPASDFDKLGITGSFSNENVPTYTVQSNVVSWEESNKDLREFRWKGPDTTGQGYTISNVTYYQYRGINRLYGTDSQYNVQLQETINRNPKLNRFYFYRFTGKGGGVADLDNYLFAVDTYSKFIFAFTEPVEFTGMGAPTRWSPTDLNQYSEQDPTRYMFYEYDPVGYFVKNGEGNYSAVLYDWFTKNLAVGNYKPQMGTGSGEATKTPEGAGKSPFNAHDKDYFVDNIKVWEKLAFISRPSETDEYSIFHENGSWLYSYVFDATNNTITEKKEQYGTGKVETGRTFTYSSAKSASEAYFKDGNGNEWVFNIGESGNSFTLVKDNEKIEVSAGSDPGPSWLIRVRGKTYEGSGYTYKFSEDGRTINLSNGKTYTYAQQDENNRAVYKQQAAVFWGAKLTDNDSCLMWTPTSWASAGSTPSSLANEYPAWIQVIKAGNFAENVKGVTFSYREADGYTGSDGKGYGLNLKSIKFSSDGKSAEFITTPWRGNGQRYAIYTMDENEIPTDSKAVYGGKEFTLDDSVHVLTVDGVKYYRNFADPGPSFKNRVKDNPSFISSDGKTSYKFLDGGNKLEVTWTTAYWLFEKKSTETYNFERDDQDRRCAVYNVYTGIWQFYGIELSNNDNTIRMTSSSSKEVILWTSLGWDSYRQ